MVKTQSEINFQDRFRREKIIPLKGLDSKEKLEIAMKKGMGVVSTRQLILAYEVMDLGPKVREDKEYRIPKRVVRSHHKYYSYHGRPARSIGRNTREEIITDAEGKEILRYRDYKTGRFVTQKKKDKNPEKVN